MKLPPEHKPAPRSLDQILDQLAGVEAAEPPPFGSDGCREDDALRPLPLSQEMIDRTVRAVQARAVEAPHPIRRSPTSRWRMVAAILPAVVLLGFVGAYPFLTEPNYESALHVAFDLNYDVESRNTAIARIATPIWHGILAVHRIKARHPGLATEVDETLENLENTVENAAIADNSQPLASGTFAKILVRLQNGTDEKVLRKDLNHFFEASQMGIAAMHLASAFPGLIGNQTQLRLKVTLKYIRGTETRSPGK